MTAEPLDFNGFLANVFLESVFKKIIREVILPGLTTLGVWILVSTTGWIFDKANEALKVKGTRVTDAIRERILNNPPPGWTYHRESGYCTYRQGQGAPMYRTGNTVVPSSSFAPRSPNQQS